MSIWNAATTTVTTSLNVITTTALTVDKTVLAGYHGARALESTAANWADDVEYLNQQDQAERRETRTKNRAMANAQTDLQHDRSLKKDPELAAYYSRHLAILTGSTKETAKLKSA